MNPKLSIKLAEQGEHKASDVQAEAEPADGANRWSTAVRSWVVEFEQHRTDESLPAFDSLFKDALP